MGKYKWGTIKQNICWTVFTYHTVLARVISDNFVPIYLIFFCMTLPKILPCSKITKEKRLSLCPVILQYQYIFGVVHSLPKLKAGLPQLSIGNTMKESFSSHHTVVALSYCFLEEASWREVTWIKFKATYNEMRDKVTENCVTAFVAIEGTSMGVHIVWVQFPLFAWSVTHIYEIL